MSLIGIVDAARLYMYSNDHPPPHFHVLFAEYRAVIDIESMKLDKGDLPKAKLRAVLRWARPRKAKLLDAWNVTQEYLVPEQIR